MKFTKTINLLTLALGLLVSGELLAHVNFVPSTLKGERMYYENTSAFLRLNTSHGCGHGPDPRTPLEAITLVFPNGTDSIITEGASLGDIADGNGKTVSINDIAFTTERDGTLHGANAIMTGRVNQDPSFEMISIPTGPVPEYYSHGSRTEANRAVQWEGANISDRLYKTVEVRANFPKLKGCVTKLRVYMPAISYCSKGTSDGWYREPTPSVPAEGTSVGYSPYVDVMRDLESNPLDESCNGESTEAEAYPSENDLESYLLPCGGNITKNCQQ